MGNESRLKSLSKKYIQRSMVMGIVYFAIPTIIMYIYTFITLPFREIYILRMTLTFAVGIPIAAFAHRYGISLWVMKHRSSEGPASILDGMAIGSGVALFMALIPPFFMLIKTNHIEEVKWLMISIWVGAFLIGGILGGIVAAIGRKHLT